MECSSIYVPTAAEEERERPAGIAGKLHQEMKKSTVGVPICGKLEVGIPTPAKGY
jgi:hypothetical protein